ncbi:MAG: hypothetical protein IJ551_03480 [Prevotella sp.]|nr:hypothetical protein [Prevotella sp.]
MRRLSNIRFAFVCFCVLSIIMTSCRKITNQDVSSIDANPDSVRISLDIHSGIVDLGCVQIFFSGTESKFFTQRWDEDIKQLFLNDTIKENVVNLIDDIILKRNIPIYVTKRTSNIIECHEGEILEITTYVRGKEYNTRLLIGSVYTSLPQLTQFGYEVTYSSAFCQLIQYLYWIMATSYDDQARNEFVDMLDEISKREGSVILFPKQEWINTVKSSKSYSSYKMDQEFWWLDQ